MHPEIRNFVYVAKANNIYLSTTTNGLLVPHFIDILHAFDMICFSIDGKSEYGHHDFKAFQNLIMASKIIDKEKLMVNIIRTKENQKQIDFLVNMIKPFVNGISIGDICPWSKELEEQNISKKRNGVIQSCLQPWEAPTINPHGDVYPCCILGDASMIEGPIFCKGHRFDAKKYNMGNINEQEIGDIWDGKKFQRFRRKLKEVMRFDKKNNPCFYCPHRLGIAYRPSISYEKMWVEKNFENVENE